MYFVWNYATIQPNHEDGLNLSNRTTQLVSVLHCGVNVVTRILPPHAKSRAWTGAGSCNVRSTCGMACGSEITLTRAPDSADGYGSSKQCSLHQCHLHPTHQGHNTRRSHRCRQCSSSAHAMPISHGGWTLLEGHCTMRINDTVHFCAKLITSPESVAYTKMLAPTTTAYALPSGNHLGPQHVS